MNKFEVSTDKNAFYRFNFIGQNGQILLKSESYTTKGACENGIASVLRNGTDEHNYFIKESSHGKYFLVLRASNGQIIATSNFFNSRNAAVEHKGNLVNVLRLEKPFKVVNRSD